MSERTDSVEPSGTTGPADAPKEETHMSHSSMATGTPQGHAPIARPVCSLHKTPKRAHYYCLQCVEAGEYEVNINSANVAGPADAGSRETLRLIAALRHQAEENGCYCEGDISPDEAGIPIGERCPYCLMGRASLALEAALAASASTPAADAGSHDWQPIETAPMDGSVFRAYHPALVHADFNPGGSVEACFDGERIIGAVWNGTHDIWNTLPIAPSHWMPPPAPPKLQAQDTQPAQAAQPSNHLAFVAGPADSGSHETLLRDALAYIAENDPDCRCDHDTEDCCVRVGSGFCGRCYAWWALKRAASASAPAADAGSHATALEAMAREYADVLPGNSEIRPLREMRLAALRFAIAMLADAGSHETAVTRFEVIDHRNPDGVPGRTCGRVYSAHGCKIELSYQDGGRTLKVFVDLPAASASDPAAPRETPREGKK